MTAQLDADTENRDFISELDAKNSIQWKEVCLLSGT
jgi:hypothetical protein